MSARDPEGCLCTALRQAARRVSQHYDAALAPANITTNQFSILSRLDRIGPTPVRTLAQAMVMDRSTLGHLLRPLEARGLVVLASPETDRRRRDIHLTDEGRRLIDRARPLWLDAQHRFESAYGPEQSRALRADLARICATETADVRPA